MDQLIEFNVMKARGKGFYLTAAASYCHDTSLLPSCIVHGAAVIRTIIMSIQDPKFILLRKYKLGIVINLTISLIAIINVSSRTIIASEVKPAFK